MKNYKLTVILILGLIFTGCNLEEEPPFLANANVYSSSSTAKSALTGLYQSLTAYDYYGNQFVGLANLNSGFFVTPRGGNNNGNVDNVTLCSLVPNSNSDQSSRSWSAIYASIGRANDAITSAKVFDSPIEDNELIINDVVGQAYFFRAFNYFNLVRLYGDVPLRITPTTTETIHLAKSPAKAIYDQIIADVQKAQQLLNGAVGNETIKPQAADMLLAKVYMTLATAPSEYTEPGLDYWQLAYNEAIKAYGAYTLVPNYDDLFTELTGNNTEEAIFELQSSVGATLDHTRAYTPQRYILVNTFGWLKTNAEVYDLHVATYPGDPRIATTFISTWTRTNNGSTANYYPIIARNSFNNGFPFLFKLGGRDISSEIRETTKNFKIYRYADLLLMLAEISNELQNGQEFTYLNEVLARVGLTPHAGYSGGQEAFRNGIMKEYQFELLGETHEWFNNRRRGYQYFLNNVIIPHNTAPTFASNVDVTHSDNEALVMTLPIPDIEINTNDEITN